MSNISKRKREGSRTKIKGVGDHKEFLKRITKTLYYGQLPTLPCLSLPVTEVSCEAWSMAQRGRSLRRLHVDAAAGIARAACVSPCALVLAVLYLERLNACNPDYLAATPPADLFLVSLMVGNKFLQDDGEDEEVICSEWATSGGLELDQLKKLEVEFLSAIDWNVFVSEKAFATGLCWLEKQVALKQAQMRGFFTYTDLIATYDLTLLTDLIRSLTSSCLTVLLGYCTSILTLVTSTFVISQACLPAIYHIAVATPVSNALDTNIIMDSIAPDLILTAHVPNSTLHLLAADLLAAEVMAAEKVKCCTKWIQYQDNAPKKTWYSGVVYDWTFEQWWSKTSILNWLYQSSLVNPMQRWLERINEYADLFKTDLTEPQRPTQKCHDYAKYLDQDRCVRQWLNLSKLGALAASMSDR